MSSMAYHLKRRAQKQDQGQEQEYLSGFPTLISTNIPALWEAAYRLTLVDQENYSDRVNNQLQNTRFLLREWAKEISEDEYLCKEQILSLKHGFDEQFRKFVGVSFRLASKKDVRTLIINRIVKY